MDNKRIILCLMLTLVCLLTAACSAREEASEPAASAFPAEPTAALEEPEASPTMPGDQQIGLLESMSDQWMHTNEFEHWLHTFTDLDHNGRYEVITASIQGTGQFTYSEFYELSEDHLSIDKCAYPSEEGSSMSDIITSDPVSCYYDAAGDTYYYLFTDFIRNGSMESWECKMALSLKNGTVTENVLATAHYLMDGSGGYSTDYSDAQGAACSEDEFNNAAELKFGGMALSQITLEWIDEAPEEAVGSAPVLPEEGIAVNIVITKNPTGETVAPGGEAWFIAEAENFDIAFWEMMSPDGEYHTLDDTVSLCPGTEFNTPDGTTLVVSNITEALNGWAVVVRYQNDSGSVRTEPAFIYVE